MLNRFKQNPVIRTNSFTDRNHNLTEKVNLEIQKAQETLNQHELTQTQQFKKRNKNKLLHTNSIPEVGTQITQIQSTTQNTKYGGNLSPTTRHGSSLFALPDSQNTDKDKNAERGTNGGPYEPGTGPGQELETDLSDLSSFYHHQRFNTINKMALNQTKSYGDAPNTRFLGQERLSIDGLESGTGSLTQEISRQGTKPRKSKDSNSSASNCSSEVNPNSRTASTSTTNSLLQNNMPNTNNKRTHLDYNTNKLSSGYSTNCNTITSTSSNLDIATDHDLNISSDEDFVRQANKCSSNMSKLKIGRSKSSDFIKGSCCCQHVAVLFFVSYHHFFERRGK